MAARRRTTQRRLLVVIALKLVMVAANTAMLFVNVPPWAQLGGIVVQLLPTGVFFVLLFGLISLPQRRGGNGG